MATENNLCAPVWVVGTGKLAAELLAGLGEGGDVRPIPWGHRGQDVAKAIVVHAGSGRELGAVVAYCTATESTLIELATGSALERATLSFPVVLCPNTNILMLKVMCMLETSGHLFQGHAIRFTESHQSQKTSVPGTAVSMAQSLGLRADEVTSVRDPDIQRTVLRIPDAHLGRHAFHLIEIDDGHCRVSLETAVYGESPYVSGVANIVAAVRVNRLENRVYRVAEFIRNGWL